MNFQTNFSFNTMLATVFNQIRDSGIEFYSRIFLSILFLCLIFLLRFLLLRFLKKKGSDKSVWRKWKHSSAYIFSFISLLFLLPLWISSIREVLTFLGIFGAGILIVFKEVFLNLAAWFYLKIRKPIDIGNRITINEKTGDVFEMRLMDFSMIEVNSRKDGGQSTGRILHIPNSALFLHPVANASKEFSFNWNEIEIQLTLGSDWKKAESLILEIACNCMEEITKADDRIKYSAEEHSIQYSHLTPFVFVEVKEGNIVLNLRHLTEPKKTRIITNTIWRKILEKFKNESKIKLIGHE